MTWFSVSPALNTKLIALVPPQLTVLSCVIDTVILLFHFHLELEDSDTKPFISIKYPFLSEWDTGTFKLFLEINVKLDIYILPARIKEDDQQ